MGHPRPLSRPVGPCRSSDRSVNFSKGSKSLFTDPAITTRPFPMLWSHSHAIANHFLIGHPSFYYSNSSTLNSGVLSGCAPEKVAKSILLSLSTYHNSGCYTNTVSWNNKVFLSADIRQLIHPQWQFPVSASFFIEEEKKIAVVFAKDTDIQNPTREVAYIIGVDGSIKAADVRESADKVLTALVCSYVPSLVKLN
ncbi:hypothetical protein YC2023_009677 [Brassica napus]